MTGYKATPHKWRELEEFSSDDANACILELRARVEALEAQGRNYPETPDSSTPPPVATDEELRDIVALASTLGQARRAIYDLGIEHGLAFSREVAEPAPVAGELVERVKLAIDRAQFDEDEHQWDEARAAIFEVAAWLDTRGQHGCSLWLREELEAGR
jgi:hypothetical protein